MEDLNTELQDMACGLARVGGFIRCATNDLTVPYSGRSANLGAGDWLRSLPRGVHGLVIGGAESNT